MKSIENRNTKNGKRSTSFTIKGRVIAAVFFSLIYSSFSSDSLLEYDGGSDSAIEWALSQWIEPPAAKELCLKVSCVVLREAPKSFLLIDGWCFDENKKSVGGFVKGKATITDSDGKWRNIEQKIMLPNKTARLKLCITGKGAGKFRVSYVFLGENPEGKNLIANPTFSLRKNESIPENWNFTRARKNSITWVKETAGKANIPLLRLRKCVEPPRIDGNLNDKCWQNASQLKDFVLLNGAFAKEKTEACLSYDERNIYFAIVCHESEMKKLVLKNKNIWENDCIELFLSPDRNNSEYFHIMLDANGRISEMKRFTRGAVRKRNQTLGSRAKVVKHPGFWVLEAAIPVAEVVKSSQGVKRGDSWRINICRQEQPHDEKSSWAPVKGYFHMPEYFGKLVFGGNKLPAIKADIPYLVTDGKNTISITLKNPGLERVKTVCSMKILNANNNRTVLTKSKISELASRQEKKDSLKFGFGSSPTADKNNYLLILTLTDVTHGNILYRSQPLPFSIYSAGKKITALEKLLGKVSKLASELPKNKIQAKYLREAEALNGQLKLLKESVGASPENRDGRETAAQFNSLEARLFTVYRELEGYAQFKECSGGRELAFIAGTADSLEKITDSTVNKIKISKRIDISAARNEYESFQLMIIPVQKKIKQVSFSISDLKQADGNAVINKNRVAIKKIEFVKTENSSYKPDYKGLCPDILLPVKTVSVLNEKRSWHPYWITLHVPPDAVPGNYRGRINISGNGCELAVELNLKVWDFKISGAPHLKTAFNLTPSWLSNFYCGSSKYRKYDFLEAYKNFATTLQNYYIQTHYSGIWYSPLEVLYNGIPKHYLTKNKNGTFDFSEVIECLKCFKKAGMNCFATAAFPRKIKSKTFPETFKRDMLDYLTRYKKALKENDLLQYGYFYLSDEPEPQTYEAIKDISINVCAKACPAMKKMIVIDRRALDSIKYLADFVDIWVVHMDIFNSNFSKLQKAGKELWFYMCNTEHPYPALYIDYPSVDYRVIPWICWKYDAKGFLYWGGNGWHRCGNSAKKMKGDYPGLNWNTACNLKNGGSYIIYPGFDANRKPIPLVSLRMEVFRDGMEDYEYLYILKQRLDKLKKMNSKAHADLISDTEKLLKLPSGFVKAANHYTKTPADFYEIREKIAAQIIKISKITGP
ncbi:MAG: glycoside hydrolase domain-containing protein [Victivallales bacterium]